MPRDTKSEAHFSIRLAARMSGVASHTLRMWERRYGFPAPKRTSGGARRYSEADIARLKLVAQAIESGYPTGEVVRRSFGALSAILERRRPAPEVGGISAGIEATLSALRSDDVAAAKEHLRQAVATLGPKRFLVDFAHPLAVEIGDRWEACELAIRQEHAASELLSTQLRAMLSGFDVGGGRPHVLLTTLPDERHGLPLEMVALYLALHQATPRSLGVSTPVTEIARAAQSLGVDVVGLSVSRAAAPRALLKDVRALLDELPRSVELWLGGRGSVALDLDDLEITRAPAWTDIDRALTRWRGRAR